MGRSVLGIITGYLLFGLSGVALFRLTGRDPHAAAPIPFMAVAIGWGGAFAIAAGYISAKIARRKETQHAIVLGILMAAGAAGAMLADPGGARWTELSTMIIFAPCAVLGGFVRSMLTGEAPRTQH